jgi:hypothetical protein
MGGEWLKPNCNPLFAVCSLAIALARRTISNYPVYGASCSDRVRCFELCGYRMIVLFRFVTTQSDLPSASNQRRRPVVERRFNVRITSNQMIGLSVMTRSRGGHAARCCSWGGRRAALVGAWLRAPGVLCLPPAPLGERPDLARGARRYRRSRPSAASSRREIWLDVVRQSDWRFYVTIYRITRTTCGISFGTRQMPAAFAALACLSKCRRPGPLLFRRSSRLLRLYCRRCAGGRSKHRPSKAAPFPAPRGPAQRPSDHRPPSGRCQRMIERPCCAP